MGKRTGAGAAGVLLFGCGAMLTVPFAAAAQDRRGETPADELVVTGERRPVALSQTPASITRLDAEEILRANADHPSEILARAPGVLIHRGSGQEHLTSIRSPVLTGGAGAGSFLFLENGVPLRSAGFANVNGLFEAQTELAGAIEVVRGPSGALYGANAIHGVINVLPRSTTEDFSGLFDFSGDTIERFKGRAFASAGIGEGQSLGLGVAILEDPGFRAASGVDQQKISLRHNYEGDGVRVDTFLSATNLNQETAGFVLGDDAYLDPDLRRTNPNPEAFRDARSVRLSSRIDIDAGETATVSVTPFARWTDMDFLLHFLPSKALEENGHWSVGSQNAVYVDKNRWSLIAGVDWEYTEGFLTEFQSIPTVFSFTQGLHYDYDVNAVSVSGFAQGAYEITDRLTATAASRVDYTRYDYVNNTDAGVVGRFLRPASRVDEFTTASPKFSLRYDTGSGSAYVSYARGARPPQTTDLYRLQINQTTDAADPETIDAVEIGWRGAIGPRLSLDAAAYYMVKDNFFFRDADGFNVDDGKTRHVGAEAALDAALTDALSLNLNASYAAHTYRFDRAANGIVSGADVDTAPRWLAGARALWRPLDLPVEGEVEWVFVDDYFLGPANSRTYPGHNLLHLRGSWAVTENFRLYAALRNVLDKFYAERADFAFGDERYFPGEERTLTVGLRLTK